MVTITKEKQQNNSRGTFDISRFEKVMKESGTTWDELNNEIDVRTKKMLTNKSKQPMLNVVSKCCMYMGIDGAYDYVMDKSEFTRRQPTMVNQQNQNTRYKCNVDVFKKAIRASQWNIRTLSYLLETKGRMGLHNYRYDTFTVNDVTTICWALKLSPRKLFGIDSDVIPTKRTISKTQTEKITEDDFKNISLADLCSRAKVDRRLLDFSNGPIYVSDDMYIRLDDYKRDTDKKGMDSYNDYKHKTLPKKTKRGKKSGIDTFTEKILAGEAKTKEKKEMNTTLTQKIQVPQIKEETKEEKPMITNYTKTMTTNQGTTPANKESNDKSAKNNGQQYKRPFINNKDVLDRIAHMSDAELDKVEKYIKLVREMRQISDNF